MSNDALRYKGWYASAGSAAGGKVPEGEGPLPAHSDTDISNAEWERMLSRSRKPVSHMPRGGALSPRGDIGELRQREARKVVPIPGVDAVEKASKYLPAKRAGNK